MCGIAGFFSVNPDPRLQLGLEGAMRALNHRGPDGHGIFISSSDLVGLTHTRLAIQDLSTNGSQPMMASGGNVVLIFNGEIYNFKELRSELLKSGFEFNGDSDTEVLLNFYLSVRDDPSGIASALRRLNGIFAFAIWDAQLGSLLIARDALGVKPLYYYEHDGLFAFASELKALRQIVPDCLKDLDPAAIDGYLSFLWTPGDATPSKKTRKVNPGEALWIRNGSVEKRCVWYQLPGLRFKLDSVFTEQMNEQTAISGTTKFLQKAVKSQMVSDVPVGAFLSGGLDSSSIVALAREHAPDIQCFTIDLCGGVKEEGFADDLPYARRVAKHLNVNLEVVSVDSSTMAEALPKMVEYLDEPIADPASLNVLFISQLARKSGIKVLLSGAGGDDLFTGYRRHRALMLESAWAWLPYVVRRTMQSFSSSLDQRRPLSRRLRKLFNGADLDANARLMNYFRWVDRKDLDLLYSREFRHALGASKADDALVDFMAKMPDGLKPLEKMLLMEQRFFLADHNLVYTDKMSMAEGVEVRVPFLDLDLVEFASSIPLRFKQRGSESKWVLKKAMEPYLPADIIYRSKSGFGAPVRHWIRYELRELVAEILNETSLQERGLFDSVAVQRLINANDAGEVDASYTILSLMCIELWCRNFMDQPLKLN